MNRRQFLTTLGAIPIVAHVAPFEGVLAAKSPVELTYLDPSTLQPWQQLIWQALSEGKDVMYITSTPNAAKDVYDLFGRHRHLWCTSVQAAVAGRRADLVVVDDYMAVMNIDWFDQTVRTRLTPNAAPIVWVSPRVPPVSTNIWRGSSVVEQLEPRARRSWVRIPSSPPDRDPNAHLMYTSHRYIRQGMLG